ncbi:MAG TPA: homocysteine S-methyltransferase family protein [Anaerolineales bacterium]|nr:homocysteine S-methyltransferase family protein [Anaerolineales bacterium]
MERWQALLDRGGLALADGAMGTMLFDQGLESGGSPELWNVDHPDRVEGVHRGYLEAGADLILTNTFGGNRFRLALHGLEGRVAELNLAGAQLARQAAARLGGRLVVAGDIGPSGGILQPLGDLAFRDAVDGFAEQSRALIDGGVDVVWIETMSDLEEVHAAIDGVRRISPTIPVLATMTFDTRGHTMMGVTPEQAAEALQGWGAAAIGGNCGNGPEEILAVVEKMRRHAPSARLVAKANAGIPAWKGGRAVYGAGPEEMAAYATAVAERGAWLIGACCGSTPAHLSAMAGALGSPRQPVALTREPGSGE